MSSNAAGFSRCHAALLATVAALFIWSGAWPRDRITWALEVWPVLLAAVILVATYRRFRLTDLAYALIWFHAAILMLGGHWTYVEMPVFEWLRDLLGWQRNYYDRFAHVVQGFVPAILVREILLRTSPLRAGKWLTASALAFTLAISASYELLEWSAALALGQDADRFLATQGDPWDTQWDMFLALLGAITSLLMLRGHHDAALRRMELACPANVSRARSAGDARP